MRIRATIALVLLLLPAVSSAQRIRLPGTGRGPTRPAPLPPQPASLARELSYRRLPVAIESYPLFSHFRSSGFLADGVASSWTSAGVGTRADYRVIRFVSVTLDLTSSFLGGPAITQTLELGTRLRPERTERKIYPFVDVRFGYMNAQATSLRAFDFADAYSTTAPTGPGARRSQGFGGVGGVGMEYALTRTLSLTSAASMIRTRMTTYTYNGVRSANDSYRMTSYRYTLGIRWNPVRLIRQPGTELSASVAPSF